jgi:hypothetical protein
MRRARSNPDTGPWLIAGGVAVGIVGLLWLLTRPSSSASASTASANAPPVPQPSTPGNYNTTYGPAYTPPLPTIPTGPRPDYQIVASNTSVALKVGQILAIAQPHPAASDQNWQVLIQPPQQGGVYNFPDAKVQDLGWQPDYTDLVQPTAPGGSTVVMNLYQMEHGQVAESYAITLSVSA